MYERGGVLGKREREGSEGESKSERKGEGERERERKGGERGERRENAQSCERHGCGFILASVGEREREEIRASFN